MAEESEALLKLFRRIFSGYQDSFTVHAPPFTLNEKKGKLQANFCGVAEYGTVSFPDIPEGYEKGDLVPVTEEQYKAHLNGEYGVAISPLLDTVTVGKQKKKNVCPYGIIDIDCYGQDYLWLINRLYNDGFQFTPFISKSKGLHLYFIFEAYESAKEVRKALQELVDRYGLNKLYCEKNVGKVEIFPAHDERKGGKSDKSVFLPFFNAVDECPNRLLTAEGKLVGIKKALPMIEKQFTTLEAIQKTLSELPYSDAPYCIQAILLSGALWEGSHRNDFLFTSCIYLKQKLGADKFTEEAVAEMNDRLQEPLELKDVKSCFNSVKDKDFPLLGQCKKEPVCSWCDRKQCAQRTFAPMKKDKNNIASNIEFGQVTIMKGESEYYLIEAREAGTDNPFVQLQINSAADFLVQKNVQAECLSKVRQTMWTVKQQVWEERVNEIMKSAVVMDIPKVMDTSDLSDMQSLFYRYLTHSQVQSNSPFRITLKQVYKKDGMYYFQAEGLKDYLRLSKFSLNGKNLTEALRRYGCEAAVLNYTRRNGTEGKIDCWRKAEDGYSEQMRTYITDAEDQDIQVIEQHKVVKAEESSSLPPEEIKF